MQRLLKHKTTTAIIIIYAILLCTAAFSVSFAAWEGGFGSAVAANGSIGLYYVDYPDPIVSTTTTTETVEPSCPTNTATKKSIGFKDPDGNVLVLIAENCPSGINFNCHIWKQDVAAYRTTWPGPQMDGQNHDIVWNLSETIGIIISNGGGYNNRTGDGTNFFNACFKDIGGFQADYIYTIDFSKIGNCNTGTNQTNLKNNITVQGKLSSKTETSTEIIHGDETAVVRSVGVEKSFSFKNYVCVSREKKYADNAELVEVTDPSFAYVNFSVTANDAQDLMTPVKSFKVTRSRTDKSGVPIGGSFPVQVYGSPEGMMLGAINDRTYIMLDFGLDSNRYNALDVQIETQDNVSYVLKAEATYKDTHTYQVASSCYLGFGDWTMREPVLMSGLVSDSYVDVSIVATLTAGEEFKMFGSGAESGGNIEIAKYFGASNYHFKDGIDNNFTKPQNTHGDNSNIKVVTGGKYFIRYYGKIDKVSGTISDWTVENLEIALLPPDTEREEIVIACEADLAKLNGMTAAELYVTPITLQVTDTTDALYGKTLTVITSAADLAAIAGSTKANVYYYQANDISTAAMSSLFDETAQFTGVYNGGGHSIEKITAAGGLFGYVGKNGIVKNATVNVELSSSQSDYMGGIASVNDGTIQQVTVNGSIASTIGTVNNSSDKTNYGTGGIVGKNNGVVKDCINNAKVSGKITVGGIVGYNVAGATVENCTNTALIGASSTTTNHTGVISWAGGLVGVNGGSITRSINGGNISAPQDPPSYGGAGNGNNYLAGLVAENISSGVVSECISTGNVSGDYGIAGLVALNQGTVKYSINNGNVSSRWTASVMVVDNKDGTVTNCVSTGSNNASGGDKYVVGELKSQSGANITLQNGSATNSYYKSGSGTAPSGDGNAVYDVSTIAKVISMLDVLKLEDKFAYDGENVTLAYTVETSKLTFTVNGNIYKAFNIKSGVTIDLSAIAAPESGQLSFNGWYLADDADKQYVTVYTVDEDAEFVADIDKKKFTVYFVTVDGTAIGSVIDYFDANISDKMPDAPAPATGYEFDGWYEEGATEMFDPAAERNGEITLIARYNGKPYTVTFDANYENGSVSPKSKSVIFGDAFGELPTPEREGYGFVGWYTQNGENDDWGDKITANSTVNAAENITLYAQWQEGTQPSFTQGLNYTEIVKNGVAVGYEIKDIGVATDTDIVIPSEYNGLPVTRIASNAFKDGATAIKSIVVPDTVETIGENAFSGCTNIESITLPFVGSDKTPSSTQYKRFFGYIFSATTQAANHKNSIPKSLKTVILSKACTQIGGSSFICSNSTFDFTLVILGNITSIDSNNIYIKTIYRMGDTDVTKLSADGAVVYDYSEAPPADDGHYWHYVDGKPQAW